MSGSITGNRTVGLVLSAAYADPVTNTGTFALTGPGDAIYAASPWTIVNEGSVGALTATSDAGISLAAGGTVTNETGGVITGGYGISLASGTVVNEAGGLIETYDNAVHVNGTLTLDNAGIIHTYATSMSDVVAFGAAYATNSGTMISNRRDGFILEAGGAVTNAASGTINANLNILYGGSGPTTFVNAGYAVATNGAAIYLKHGGYIDNQAGGAIVNASAHAVIYATAASVAVTNAGTILSKGRSGVVLVGGGTVVNAAGGQITAALSGIYGSKLALGITNASLITAGGSGVVLETGGVLNNLATGTIVGTKGAFYGATASPAPTIINAGFMASETHSAIGLHSGGEVTNEARGTIAASKLNAIYVVNGSGLILNAGLITSPLAGAIHLDSGGTVSNATGGTIVSGLGNAVYVTNASGLVVNAGLLAGSQYSAVHLADGGTISNLAGGTLTSSGGLAVYVTAGAGAIMNAGLITASRNAIYLLDGGNVSNLSTGVISFVRGRGAATTVETAGTLGGAALGAGFANLLKVEPGAVFTGPVDGGNTIGATATSTLELAPGSGTLANIGVSISQFGAIAFEPGAAWLLSGTTYGLAGGETITGFAPGDTIELTGTAETYAALGGGTLTLSGGTTLDVPLATHVKVADSAGNTFITACFAEGTRIMTGRGAIAVEMLAEGECVLTASGRFAPVRWIGHRRTSLRRHPRPHDVMPVRVHAGAFGPNLPGRDLVLSPDHSVFVDGHLVPIRYLINGVSIVQESRAAVTYWHVELDRHDIILAEGMPCESYLDTGNRDAFENADGPMELHPDFARAVWAAQGCAPILTDPADPALRALHTRLLANPPGRERRIAHGAAS